MWNCRFTVLFLSLWEVVSKPGCMLESPIEILINIVELSTYRESNVFALGLDSFKTLRLKKKTKNKKLWDDCNVHGGLKTIDLKWRFVSLLSFVLQLLASSFTGKFCYIRVFFPQQFFFNIMCSFWFWKLFFFFFFIIQVPQVFFWVGLRFILSTICPHPI